MTKTLSPNLRTHVTACGLNATQVGDFVGAGAGHVVFAYAENKVIKIPRLSSLKSKLNILTAEDSKTCLALAKEHFPTLVTESSVHNHSTKSSYCIVQERLYQARNVHKKDIQESAELHRQWVNLLKQNAALKKMRGYSLDFLGQEGCIKTTLAKPQMTNLVRVETPQGPQIKLLEYHLFKVHNRRDGKACRWAMNEISHIGYLINWVLLRGWFGWKIA